MTAKKKGLQDKPRNPLIIMMVLAVCCEPVSIIIQFSTNLDLTAQQHSGNRPRLFHEISYKTRKKRDMTTMILSQLVRQTLPVNSRSKHEIGQCPYKGIHTVRRRVPRYLRKFLGSRYILLIVQMEGR